MTWRRRQGQSLPDAPSLPHHRFPLVAQWQSNRLISDRRMFDSSREDQSPRRWIRSVKPEWRWSGFLTRAHVVRNHPDPPVMDLCPQRPRERILDPKASSVRVRPGPPPKRAPVARINAPLRIWMRRPHCRCGEGGSIPLRSASFQDVA